MISPAPPMVSPAPPACAVRPSDSFREEPCLELKTPTSATPASSHRKLAIEGGYLDVPYTLDEATSSNDILFLERASSQVIAANVAASDFRSAAGARWYTDSFWIGAYATGPTAGAIHSASSTNPNGTTEQLGAAARIAGQVVTGKDYSLHIGGDAEFL